MIHLSIGQGLTYECQVYSEKISQHLKFKFLNNMQGYYCVIQRKLTHPGILLVQHFFPSRQMYAADIRLFWTDCLLIFYLTDVTH